MFYYAALFKLVVSVCTKHLCRFDVAFRRQQLVQPRHRSNDDHRFARIPSQRLHQRHKGRVDLAEGGQGPRHLRLDLQGRADGSHPERHHRTRNDRHLPVDQLHGILRPHRPRDERDRRLWLASLPSRRLRTETEGEPNYSLST